MIVDNPNFVGKDFGGLGGLGGLGSIGALLGLGTCQWPQPGVPMVYPSCATDSGYIKAELPTSIPIYSGVTSVYDLPNMSDIWKGGESCLDEGGFVIADSACVDRNLQIQQDNFKRLAEYNTNLVANTQPQKIIRNPISGESYVVKGDQVTNLATGAPVGTVKGSGPVDVSKPQTTSVTSPSGSSQVTDIVDKVTGFVDDIKSKIGMDESFLIIGAVVVFGGLWFFGKGR